MIDSNSVPEALLYRYHASLAAKHAELEAAWRAVCADCHDIDNQKILVIRIHRLAGSAESYGYPEIGNAAAVADALLDRVSANPDPAGQSRAMCGVLERMQPIMDTLLDALRSAADQVPGGDALKR